MCAALNLTANAYAEFDWPGHSGPLRARLYRSGLRQPTQGLLVFFAPGGFVAPDLHEADGCLRVLADGCGVNVLAPYYAEAPERAFPAPVEDAHVVLGLVMQHKQALGWKGAKLFVGGCEAGGNLAAVSALVCRDRLGPELAGQILVTPMLDASMGCGSMRCAADAPGSRELARAAEEAYRRYLPHPADRLHPYASPLNTRRLGGLPPALIFHTQGDPLADEAKAYAAQLRAAGNVAHEVALPPPDELRDASDRCELTADDPCLLAMRDFMANPVDPGPACSSCQ
jgi:acetyl esterase